MPVNLNMKHGSESPVDSHRASDTGHHDTAGNVWEWCEDDFYPLEGFETHNHYTDFSTPCFDGRHQMILGGAFASTGTAPSDVCAVCMCCMPCVPPCVLCCAVCVL